MPDEKEIRFSQKKIDEGWKEQAWKDKEKFEAQPRPAAGAKASDSSANPAQTSKAFMNFLTSLGVQSLIHLGEMVHPETQTREINLEAAREIIDLLIQFKEKTQGNLSAQEAEFFNSFLPEIQMKFAQKA